MKKIVPFNNVLTFDTDVCEITAISLEHEIKKDSTCISGTFFISGEYKITDGQLTKDKFNFELPFDIALGSDYNMDTLLVDIDDFRYSLLDNKRLKVNIDLFIDGEEVVNPISTNDDNIKEVILEEDSQEDITNNSNVIDANLTKEATSDELNREKDDNSEIILEDKQQVQIDDDIAYNNVNINEPLKVDIDDKLDLLDEMLDNKKEDKMEEDNNNINIVNNNVNINDNVSENENNTSSNIFGAFNEDEEYVTYRVYRVMENDTLSNILEKYNVSKEELAKYNNIDEIHPGVKLIIPANGK